MTALTVTATITRTRLPGSLDPLDINDGTSYKIISAGPGQRRWVRETATAPSVHGAALVSARMDIQVAPLVIRVIGTSKSNLNTKTAALIAAFSQLRFNLSITVDAGIETWKCWAADIEPVNSGEWDPARFAFDGPQQIYSFQVPRQPVPTAGVL